jgi:hypothetical protein
MREYPILFSGPMVRAILEGRKTQTRRVVKFPLIDRNYMGNEVAWCETNAMLREGHHELCPYGASGDRLLVRETWRCRGGREYEYQHHQPSIVYKADAEAVDFLQAEWRPSIYMPRWASRITLEIVSVKVERVAEISPRDAISEGFPVVSNGLESQIEWFRSLWDSINSKRGFGWDKNPWVWVVEFKRL